MEKSAKKYVKAIINLILAFLALLLIIFVLPRAILFFMPFVLGYLIALIAAPPVRFLERKLKIKRKGASAFVIILVIGMVVLAGYLVGSILVREVSGFIEEIPSLITSVEDDLGKLTEDLSSLYDRLPQDYQLTIDNFGAKLNQWSDGIVEKLGSPTIAAVGNFVGRIPTILISVIMCLLSSYLFVAEKEHLGEYLKSHMPRAAIQRYQLIKRSLTRSVGGYVKAQVKIELWIYLLLVIGFTVMGVRYSLLIALGVAFLDFLPFFGTGTVMIPWAVIKFVGGNYKMTIALLLTWGISQLVRQLIQPKIVGDSVGMAPLPTLLLLFAGFKIGGVVGMILAVPLGLLVYMMYEEGVFDTTKNSIRILSSGLNHFRRLTRDDLEVIELYREEVEQDIQGGSVNDEKEI